MNHNDGIEGVWIFSGAGGRFASGVFTSKEAGVKWIAEHQLSGVLTWYPLNQGVYQWAIENGAFEPRKEHEHTANFIQNFSCASQDHYHFEDGVAD